MKSILLLIVGLICAIQPLFSHNRVTAILADRESGKISYGQSLIFLYQTLKEPEKLPPEYREIGGFIKCGTGIIAEIRDNWDKIPYSERAKLRQILNRPDLPLSKLSPSGRFKIHYDLTGNNATQLSFVDSAAAIFDHCYDFEVNTLGYDTPPIDDEDEPEYDIYLLDLLPQGAYGWTMREDPVPEGRPNDYTSYIVIDNDFTGYPTPGIYGLRVTAAHEFHHAIQFGYSYRENDIYFMEITSTWMEDVVYDEVNDYYNYLSAFFYNPQAPLDEYNSTLYPLHEYGSCIWNHFLEQNFGRDIVRQIWEDIVQHPSLEVMDDVFKNDYNTNFSLEFSKFSLWNYFTSNRADTVLYYEEGQNYPPITLSGEGGMAFDTTFSVSSNHLASHYYGITPEYAGDYRIIMRHLDNGENWGGWVVNEEDYSVYPFDFSAGQSGLSKVEELGESEDLILISSNAHFSDIDDFEYVINLQMGVQSNLANVFIYPNPYRGDQHGGYIIFSNLVYHSKISIYTPNGFLVKQMDERNAGGEVEWLLDNEKGEKVASGIYIYYISADGEQKVGKLAIIR